MKIDRHVRILAYLYLLIPAFGLGVCVLLLLSEPGTYLTLDAPGEAVSHLTFTTALVLATTAYVVLNLVASFALFRRTRWARNYVLAMGLVNLLNFPVGTLLGAYTVWVLSKEESSSVLAA